MDHVTWPIFGSKSLLGHSHCKAHLECIQYVFNMYPSWQLLYELRPCVKHEVQSNAIMLFLECSQFDVHVNHMHGPA